MHHSKENSREELCWMFTSLFFLLVLEDAVKKQEIMWKLDKLNGDSVSKN